MQFNIASTVSIREELAMNLFAKLNGALFSLKKSNIVVKNRRNNTDFIMHISFYVDKSINGVAAEPYLEVRSKSFENLYKKYRDWSAAKYGTNLAKSHEFLVSGLNKIVPYERSEPLTRRFIDDEEGANRYVELTSEAVHRYIEPWLEQFFDWESAIKLLNEDASLCGAWHEIAYFFLLQQARSTNAACEWVHGAEPVIPIRLQQVIFLRSLCQN